METAVEEELTIGCHFLVTEEANIDERYGLMTPTSAKGRAKKINTSEVFKARMISIESPVGG
jgi:hypothetical protein